MGMYMYMYIFMYIQFELFIDNKFSLRLLNQAFKSIFCIGTNIIVCNVNIRRQNSI